MKLTYEEKLKIVELHNQGFGCKAISSKFNLNLTVVQQIIYRFELHGKEGLKHTETKSVPPYIKLEIINKRKNGASFPYLQAEYLVTATQIYKWIQQYDEFGYNGLIIDKRGRPKKMSKENKLTAKPLKESEREELIRLREENKQLEMENYLLKKLRALVQQRNQQPPKKK